MRSVNLKFNGISYKVKAGDVFQASIYHPMVHQIYICQSSHNESVYLEILEKINNETGVVRVNEIHWFENGVNYKEDYTTSIAGPTNTVSTSSITGPTNTTSASFDKMTKKELIEFAETNNIEVNPKSKKAEILKIIKESV